jgi:TRAP-type mannitol/chloroaromatic compound transport system permease large subunit
MLKRKYNPEMACGSILAGGTLGILIPPSILAIIFAVVAQQSVGELFIGAFFPGFLLSGMYILYVTARSYMNGGAGGYPDKNSFAARDYRTDYPGVPGAGCNFFRHCHTG